MLSCRRARPEWGERHMATQANGKNDEVKAYPTAEILRREFHEIWGNDSDYGAEYERAREDYQTARARYDAAVGRKDEDASNEHYEAALKHNKDALDVCHKEALKKNQAALCLSGGGIRSAAFALGVLEAFARKGLLTHFHYLSTVSGGGY